MDVRTEDLNVYDRPTLTEMGTFTDSTHGNNSNIYPDTGTGQYFV